MRSLKRIVIFVVVVGVGYCNGKVSVYSWDGNMVGTYSSIQEAIGVCPAKGTVLVAPGTYTEALYINKDIAIISQGIVVISAKGLSGTYNTVIFDSDGADDAIISGFIITGAQEAGIECRNGADPKIINNTVSGNYNGIVADLASPRIVNNIILHNESDGIICWESSPTIINNTILYNGLGGIYLWNSSPTIVNNIIVENGTASIYSSGISSWGSNPYVDYNCVWGNGTDTTGDGIGDNNWDGCDRGSHDISFNPQLLNDFHLHSTSPCIDKGTNTAFISLNLPLVDKGGDKRIINGIIDIGAYEFQQQYNNIHPKFNRSYLGH